MPSAHLANEVEVLRFFEEAPIEKAEMLFNIVKEKIRGILREADAPASRRRSANPLRRKRKK